MTQSETGCHIVMRAITRNYGLTCEEIERMCGLSHQAASARIHELSGKGKTPKRIVDIGKRRATRTGRKAIVWIEYTEQMRAADKSKHADTSAEKQFEMFDISPDASTDNPMTQSNRNAMYL